MTNDFIFNDTGMEVKLEVHNLLTLITLLSKEKRENFQKDFQSLIDRYLSELDTQGMKKLDA